MEFHVINSDDLKNDPAKFGALDDKGRLRIHPATFWQQFSQAEIGSFCVVHGIYCVPTTELVDWLRAKIGQRKAIEIGAGNGVLAEALKIPATDNRLQEWPEVRARYVQTQQPTIAYGQNIEDLNAEQAMRKYSPEVVIAAWVTHRYSFREHHREGNQWGVREHRIIPVADYIFVGNRHVHRMKPILDRPHEEYEFPFLFSRAVNGAPNFIAVWRK